jgi:isocitrate dehydrogenase (NAD+)
MFEPGTRNSGTALAGKNIANPVAMLHASTDMLEHLGLRHYATILRSAIQKTIVVDRVCTKGTYTVIEPLQKCLLKF